MVFYNLCRARRFFEQQLNHFVFIYKIEVNKKIEGINFMGFPGGSDGKESACNLGDLGLIPGLGRAFGEGNG